MTSPPNSTKQQLNSSKMKNYNYPQISNATFQRLLDEGKRVEELFLSLMETAGYKARLSSESDNKYKHIDVWFSLIAGEKEYGVDVKAAKKLSRADDSVDYSIHYLELKNVWGNSGWLYGEAHYIAFEIESAFIIVSTPRLRAWVAENVENKWVNKAKDAYKMKYSRADDVITLIKVDDLLDIANRIIDKEGNVILL